MACSGFTYFGVDSHGRQEGASTCIDWIGLLKCSEAQRHGGESIRRSPGKNCTQRAVWLLRKRLGCQVQGGTSVFGDPRNLLERTDIYYNVAVEKVTAAMAKHVAA